MFRYFNVAVIMCFMFLGGQGANGRDGQDSQQTNNGQTKQDQISIGLSANSFIPPVECWILDNGLIRFCKYPYILWIRKNEGTVIRYSCQYIHLGSSNARTREMNAGEIEEFERAITSARRRRVSNFLEL